MDFQLTEQQRRMVAAVRDLAQGEFKANAQKYMDGTFPWDNMKKLADIGVLGMSVPEEYGGLGLPVFDTALVLEEIAKTCYVTAMATLGDGTVSTAVEATKLGAFDFIKKPFDLAYLQNVVLLKMTISQ